MKLDEITREVIGSAMEFHSELGAGFLESVFQRSLACEMRSRGMVFDEQTRLDITFKDQPVGIYKPDFYVEDQLIVEIKAVEELAKSHHIQTVNYLAATKIDLGLLINFGTPSLEFHRKYRTAKDPGNLQNKSC